VRLGVLGGSMPNSLVPGIVRYYRKPRIFGNRLAVSTLLGHRSVCLGLSCKVFESIDCRHLTVIRDCFN
jgi:hypothetical protein